ncbi:MAG: YajD family HNH nuclease [Methylococcales bacterium]|nr:YajD family HNH nuclease [Methylococcales bacterium]
MNQQATQTEGNKIIAEARGYKEDREKGYREQALKLFPWVCGRCAREFTHKNLQELTVHHKNHNHDQNPSDGSNWELLCLYCHDNEHSRYEEQVRYGSVESGVVEDNVGGTHNPFANLKGLLNKK